MTREKVEASLGAVLFSSRPHTTHTTITIPEPLTHPHSQIKDDDNKHVESLGILLLRVWRGQGGGLYYVNQRNASPSPKD